MSTDTRHALYFASISQDVADSLAEIGVMMAGDHPLIAVDGRVEIDLDLDLDDDLDLDLDHEDWLADLANDLAVDSQLDLDAV